MPCVPSIHPKSCVDECWFILIDKLVVIKTCGVFNGLKRIIHNLPYPYIYRFVRVILTFSHKITFQTIEKQKDTQKKYIGQKESLEIF
jgi:hypothetical protein